MEQHVFGVGGGSQTAISAPASSCATGHHRIFGSLTSTSRVIDGLVSAGLVLCNESFASTNDREGSIIARHVVDPAAGRDAVFLRPERLAGRTRSFRVLPAAGRPREPTSYLPDLYRTIVAGTRQPTA